jgi:hypothetical protein
MIPLHYLHILLGIIVGIPIGGIVIGLVSYRKMYRISADEWLAARKFYTGK